MMNILSYLPQNLEHESDIKSERIFEFNNKKIKDGKIIYLMEREKRLTNNFAIKFGIQTAKELNKDFEIITKDYLLKPSETGLLIIDFNPIKICDCYNDFDFKIYEIDGHNIIPARFISQKQEYNAFHFRKKIYNNIGYFLTDVEEHSNFENEINKFIEKKLPYYNEFRNNPTKDMTSGFSKYLNLGFISSHEIAVKIIKSDVSDENKEAFLEELIVRKELADNFCLYNKNFKTLEGIPSWAKKTLSEHQSDFRFYIYSIEEFENARTHDKLWNAAQKQLLKTGKIHGYLRMYWAKKILEWSETPEIALKIAIYLNDTYAFDAPSTNGYVGILWAIGALHDRAFKEREIIGKIRPMTYSGAKSKFDVEKYISIYS